VIQLIARKTLYFSPLTYSTQMKKLIRLFTVIAIFLCGSFLSMSFQSNDGDGGRIKVYIINKCNSDVKYKVASPGSSTHYTAYDGSKNPMTFVEGTKIYNSDGDMIHEVTASSEGKEVVVCK